MSFVQPFSVGSSCKAFQKGAPRKARPPQQATSAIFSLGQSSEKRTKAKAEVGQERMGWLFTSAICIEEGYYCFSAVFQLLEVISRLSRGASASASDKEEVLSVPKKLHCLQGASEALRHNQCVHPSQVEQLAQQLERINPTKKVLASPLLSAKWELKYTTSASILGTNKPPFLRPQGPIYQTIGEPS